MPTTAKGRLFMRKDGKYLIYVPLKIAQDSMFPFPLEEGRGSMQLKISFEKGKKQLLIEPLDEEAP